MRFTTFLLPLAASAATVLNERQLGGGGGAKVAGIDKLEPQFRKGAQRTLTKFGPYTIKGSTAGAKGASGGMGGMLSGMMGGMMGGMGGMGDSTLSGQSYFLSIRNGLCNDIAKGPCTILAGRVGVMWTDGRQADPSNGIYIHHILSSDNTKKETPWLSACGSQNRAGMSISAITGGTGFLGTGEDGAGMMTIYTSPDGTRNSGYHVGAKDVFTNWSQLVNYNKDPAQVYIFYDLEWVPGTVGDNVKGVTVSANCGTMVKTSPLGPTNTTSGKFYIMEDGRILGGRGHLHDGGVAMNMFINGKFICSSKAEYGTRAEDGGHSHGGGEEVGIQTISAMSTCKGPFPVKKGDYITLVAEYDLKKHPLRKSAGGSNAGVMAMMGMSFASGPGVK